MLAFLKKNIPDPIFCFLQKPYHFLLAFLAHIFYGQPSKKMYVIGVTGTKGKTTTANLLADILNEAGYKAGVTSSVCFRFGEERRVNDTKQGMPGRFYLQKLLAEMARKGCTHAVIETTSEGMLQYRHRFVDYDAAIFTNLSPEHIERHGGFESYRSIKVKLFEKVARKKDGVGVYNLDDENVEYFLKPKIVRKFGFSLSNDGSVENKNEAMTKFGVQNVVLGQNISSFELSGAKIEIPLFGEFNVRNATAAIVTALALKISMEKIQRACRELHYVVGRSEVIQKIPFAVIVDYAHEPKSLEAICKAANIFQNKDSGRLICLMGAQGGGRDKWKRAEMGRVAARYCDEIILTNEDSYDEDPLGIINDIVSGISSASGVKPQTQNVHKIVDREEAIKKAIFLAKAGDVVILTGKGGEVWMCVGGGKKIPWDEKAIVERVLNK